MDTTDELADKLLTRRSDLCELAEDWKPVEDVLAGPRAVKGSAIADPQSGRRQSRYLPRNLSEHPDEYLKRLAISPCFFETPGVLQARQGALFREAPKITLPDALAWFENNATASGATILDVLVKISELCQIHGFAGVLLDRAPLPADVSGRETSLAEVERRRIGRPLWAAYSAPQILDFATDSRGLLWVKLLEEHPGAAAWDAPLTPVKTVRVVDRLNISLWEIVPDADNRKSKIENRKSVVHACVDAAGLPAVPFVFFHPFPGRDGLGRSTLRGVAEADLAATRVLSELMWLLHMMAPLLTFKTNRDEQDIGDIGLGASRFLTLQLGSGSEKSEELSFTQLDPTAADRLAAQYERMVQRAKDQASRTEAAGVAGPVEQSGISKAWTFKTGEERVLHLLATCLERGFHGLLEMTARATEPRALASGPLPYGRGSDQDAVGIQMPETFDVQGPEYALEAGKELLPLFAQYGLHSAVAATLEKIFTSWIRNPSQELWDKVKGELDALEKSSTKHQKGRG